MPVFSEYGFRLAELFFGDGSDGGGLGLYSVEMRDARAWASTLDDNLSPYSPDSLGVTMEHGLLYSGFRGWRRRETSTSFATGPARQNHAYYKLYVYCFNHCFGNL